MQNVINTLQKVGFKGDIDAKDETLDTYSHDASMFEIRPKLVVSPRSSEDVEKLVATVSQEKHKDHSLSLTARSAGTDMSGGAINNSIIVDFNKYLTEIKKVTKTSARTQPGVFFRDLDRETFKHGSLLPTYPASRDLCTVGGMVSNNSGGEKSLEYGKTEDYIKEIEFVFADGIKRKVKPLDRRQLVKKMGQKDFEGRVYKQMFELIEENYEVIKAAKPKVSKDSTGYHLWNVWDRKTGIFDLTQVITGSQGTLGLVTETDFRLVKRHAHSGLLVLFMKDVDDLGEVIPKILSYKPATLECFDDATLLLGMRFLPSFLPRLGLKKWLKLLVGLAPTGLQFLKGIPKLIVMVEFNAETEEGVRDKVQTLHNDLSHLRARYEINGFEEDATEGKSEKFWLMRRQSFQLLRSKVKDKHTAPFIDDFIVKPEHLAEFLPKMRKIIKKYKLLATLAGHLGDGNFHIIPLMKLDDPKDRRKLLPAMKEVNHLVIKYGGSLSGEHNDGLVRGPWLKEMYGPRMLEIFKKTKHIFDPEGIFNPHKKADATWDYSFSHIREKF